MIFAILGNTGLFGNAVEYICKKNNYNFKGYNSSNLDIYNIDKLSNMIKNYKPDVIINTIAIIDSKKINLNPSKAFYINTYFNFQLIKICNEFGIKLIFISTVEVFSGNKILPYDENDVPNPKNLYGCMKRNSETLIENHSNNYLIIRLPALFGDRNNYNTGYFDKIFSWLKNPREKYKLTYDKFESPTYNIDAADQLIKMIIDQYKSGYYHICNDGKASLYEIVKEVSKFYKLEMNLDKAKISDYDPKNFKLKNACLTTLKLNILRDWKNALNEYLTKKEK